MSISSSLTSQSQVELIYLGDASDQQWSPNMNGQNSGPETALQWSGVQYENNNTRNVSAPTYGIEKTISDETQSPYFSQPAKVPTYGIQKTISGETQSPYFSQPAKEYVDLSYQKRDPISNGHYIPNGASIPGATYTSTDMPRNGPVYTNPYLNPPRTEQPVNVTNAWNNVNTNSQHVSRTNWNMNKVMNNGIKKPKRSRTAFTTNQMMELELEYARTRYLDRNRRIELSETLQLSEKTVKVWFQNRRMKDKKDRAEGGEDLEATSTTESSPENNMPPPPYNNYHQTVHHNTVYPRPIIHVDRYQVPMATRDMNAIPVPAHNAVVNAYPNFFTPSQVENPNLNNQEDNLPQFQTVVVNDEMDNVSSEVNDDETKSNTEEIILDVKEEESPPEFNNGVSDVVKRSVNGENWELSWVRIMNMNDEF